MITRAPIGAYLESKLHPLDLSLSPLPGAIPFLSLPPTRYAHWPADAIAPKAKPFGAAWEFSVQCLVTQKLISIHSQFELSSSLYRPHWAWSNSSFQELLLCNFKLSQMYRVNVRTFPGHDDHWVHRRREQSSPSGPHCGHALRKTFSLKKTKK